MDAKKRPLNEEPGTLKHMEKLNIAEALRRWEGNRTKAARELGITRRTIQNKIIEYGLEGKDPFWFFSFTVRWPALIMHRQ